VLFKRGDREGAISYFEKEKRMFPEPSAFMTKLIERVQQKEKEAVEKTQTNAKVNIGAKS
jgi:hypothetical protein